MGDWLLQNHWMATGKNLGWFNLVGHIHFAIYTAAILVTLWLAGIRDSNSFFYPSLGVVIFISHWLIDAGDGVERWIHLYRQSNLLMVQVMVDQPVHLLVLLRLTWFCGGV